jgi:DNA sulfur modification protein DndC
MGLRTVIAVQREINQAARRLGRPRISLINWEEFQRIRALIAANTWPQRWTGDEPRGDTLIPQTYHDGARQELLLVLEEKHS